MMPPPILLASASPRRSELLRQIGIAHEVRPVALDESTDDERGTNMILATTMVEDADRFLKVFGTKGAEKRAEHGSQGSVPSHNNSPIRKRRPFSAINGMPDTTTLRRRTAGSTASSPASTAMTGRCSAWINVMPRLPLPLP